MAGVQTEGCKTDEVDIYNSLAGTKYIKKLLLSKLPHFRIIGQSGRQALASCVLENIWSFSSDTRRSSRKTKKVFSVFTIFKSD